MPSPTHSSNAISHLPHMSLKTAIIQPGMFKSPPFTLEVPGSPHIEGETIPRRNANYVDSLVSRPCEEVATLFDVLLRSAEKFGDLDAVGTRKLIETHVEVKKVKTVVDGTEKEVEKKWVFFEMGEFEFESFGGYVGRCLRIGAGLRKLGLEAGDRVHVFAATSANWLAVSHAAVTQSLPIVTSYATLGEEGLTTSLTQTSAKAIFIDPDLLSKLTIPLQSAPAIKFIIYNDQHPISQTEVKKLQATTPNLTILPLSEVEDLGKQNLVEPVPPHPEDLCCIMYTSGTTDAPKGVPLKHRNLVAAIAGLDTTFAEYVGPSDSVLAYLPLAHSFEYAFENTCLYWGMKMGYGSPRTLSDTSMRNCYGDIKTFRPTILIGVPAVWETIRKGIEEKVSRLGWVKRNVFWGSLWLKAFLCEWFLPGTGLLDRIVFRSVKSEMGGRLRACFNGAGPLGKDTRRFISFAAVPLISGYGLTETTAMGALQDPLEWTDDTLGSIPGSIEIKLVDFADAGYFATNNPPQGEILIRGDPVMDGYYGPSASENEGAITKDGWFMTGDIGEWDARGHLKIIDRKKNLVKTLNGEYIALEKLESIYRASNIVSNICIFASPHRSKPIAIMLPDRKLLSKLAESNNIRSRPHEQLVHDPEIRDLVLKELQTVGRKAGLAPFEIIEGVVLSDEEWSSQNGLLTPAQKLARRKIVPLYQAEIDGVYGKTKSVL
ncbi:acetyl-CoA synthetase-like protein [Hyaloscypha variabilis F]|uniref:Acetyl-CoA synthetase-like protein n=1 Tax=Hyaloscypha variabilis (strain UAMH 11265 / GT02V1 / F) TaxID=1149755 RepID=A0A2J6SAJ2_HYAVF|nr:acetyl-CoA synthetase-like protein [Hyaloscypha variabilis F]